MPVMQLLIFASPFSRIGRNLQKKIQAMDPGIQSTYCASLMALDKQLRKPNGVSPIGIFSPADESELAALIGMRHLLRDMRLILILPDNPGLDITSTSAHMLRPRFISYADSDLSDVTAVLSKMNGAECGHRALAFR
jgi:hypothetical protein